MAGPSSSTCSEWATEDDLCSPCNDYNVLGPIAADFIQAASDLLFEMSGRQYPGLCTKTVRPCARLRSGSAPMDPGPPGWTRGWGWCGCGTDPCDCGGLFSVELGVYPVVDVTSVKVDGVTLDGSKYRVDDYRRLVRLADTDGSNPGWPRTQQLDKPDSAEGTWSVTFTWGREPPPAGVKAAAVLACELALACDPENQSKCRLPKNVTSVTREGVTMVLSPSDFLDKDGKTGLYEVDIFLRAVNPDRVRRRAAVWHVGMARNVRAGTD